MKNIPDAGYTCYKVPSQATAAWGSRLSQFQNINDFTEGFFQNLLGNFFTVNDAITKIRAAVNIQDYLTVVYQVGRLVRRTFDF